MERRLLTSADAAELIPTPVATLRYWRHIGYGPPSAKIGRRVMYREADVLAWIDKQFSTDPRSAA